MKNLVIFALWIAALAPECAATHGKLDTTFAPSGKARVWAIEPAPGGGVYVARDSLKRLNPDGTQNVQFACPISIEGMFASMPVVLADADGSLLVAGTFGIDAQTIFTARVLPTGQIDPNYHHATFGPALPAAIITIGVLDANGRLLLAGPFQSVDGQSVSYLTRLLPDGHRDPSFNPPDSVGFPRALATSPDGRIVVATESGVVALNSDGTIDTATAPYTGMTAPTALAISSDGKIAVGGSSGVRVLRGNLTVDPAFSAAFSVDVDDLKVDASGRVVASGDFGYPVVFGVVRYLPNGSLDPSWTTLDGTDGRIERLRITQSGDLYVSGRFATIQGAMRNGVARLHGTNSGAAAWTNTSARTSIFPDNPLILGFVIQGDEPIQALVRAVGPSLSAFAVAAPLQHPRIAIYSGSNRILDTAGWIDTTDIRSIQNRVGAFPLTKDSTDTVALATLPPGAYTLVVSAPTGEAGSVLGEVYKVQ